MRILVTGAAGLLGTELSLLLDSHGHTVVGVDNLSRYKLIGEEGTRSQDRNVEELQAAGIEFIHDDAMRIAERGLTEPPTLIVHAAAQVCHSRKVDAPDDNIGINYITTHYLLEIARKNNIPFLFISSAKVYAHSTIPLGHYSPLGDRTPMTFFGATKLAADLLCQQYAYTYGMTVGVLRPGCFTGPRALATEAQNWLPWLVHCNMHNLPFNLFGSGWQTREVMHVGDLANACDRWVEKPKSGVWPIGAGIENAITLNAAIDVVEALTGKKTAVRRCAVRKGDMPYLVVEGSTFTLDYGWRPTKSIVEIVKELVEAQKGTPT